MINDMRKLVINNMLLATILIIIIFSGVTLSGCVDKSRQNATKNISVKEKYDDEKFIKIAKEAYGIIESDKIQLMMAAERGDFESVEKYSERLESNSNKYISMMKDLTISPKLEAMYSRYYNYLEIVKKAGRLFQESAKRHELMNESVGSCSDPSVHEQQEPL